MPILRRLRRVRSSSLREDRGAPSSRTSPSSGRSNPPSRCRRVDFPDPDGPMIDMKRPAGMSRSSPSSTRSTTSPRWYSLTRPRADIADRPSVAGPASVTVTTTSPAVRGTVARGRSVLIDFRCRTPLALPTSPHGSGRRNRTGVASAPEDRGIMPDDWARPVVHWEIEALDAARLKVFYGELFNWTVGDGPIMTIPAGLGGPEPG